MNSRDKKAYYENQLESYGEQIDQLLKKQDNLLRYAQSLDFGSKEWNVVTQQSNAIENQMYWLRLHADFKIKQILDLSIDIKEMKIIN